MPDQEAADFAAALAPVIDRLVITGHQAARPYALALRDELGIPHFGVLIDLRALLLAADGVSLDTALAVERYAPTGTVVATLDEHVSQGFLKKKGAAYLPTVQGRHILLRLTDALARGLDGLWHDATVLRAALDIARTVVYAAGEADWTADFTSFGAQHDALADDTGSLAFDLWSHLDTLRCLRADAHAAAWTVAGLDAPGASLLTRLWEDERHDGSAAGVDPERDGPSLGRLQERGWLAAVADNWTLTPEGRRAREAIEQHTNQTNALAFEPLTPAQRLQWLEDLAVLPER